jgi:hypothetical protein
MPPAAGAAWLNRCDAPPAVAPENNPRNSARLAPTAPPARNRPHTAAPGAALAQAAPARSADRARSCRPPPRSRRTPAHSAGARPACPCTRNTDTGSAMSWPPPAGILGIKAAQVGKEAARNGGSSSISGERLEFPPPPTRPPVGGEIALGGKFRPRITPQNARAHAPQRAGLSEYLERWE